MITFTNKKIMDEIFEDENSRDKFFTEKADSITGIDEMVDFYKTHMTFKKSEMNCLIDDLIFGLKNSIERVGKSAFSVEHHRNISIPEQKYLERVLSGYKLRIYGDRKVVQLSIPNEMLED